MYRHKHMEYGGGGLINERMELACVPHIKRERRNHLFKLKRCRPKSKLEPVGFGNFL